MADGIAFDPQSVRADSTRDDNRYGGLRVRLSGRIDNVRCALQIDVGFGDAVTPESQTVVFPVLLNDLPAPSLKVYPVYTVIAETYHAMTILGLADSRRSHRRDCGRPPFDPSFRSGLSRRHSVDVVALSGPPE